MKHFLWCKYEWKIMAGVFPQQRKQLFMSRLTIGSARIPPGLQAHYLCPGKSLSGLLIFSQWVMALFIARSALHWLRLLNPRGSGVTQSFEKLASSAFHMAIISSCWVPSHWHASDALVRHVAYAFVGLLCLLVATRRPASTSKCWHRLWGYSHWHSISSVLTVFLLLFKDAGW